MRRYLVVANQTVTGDELARTVATCAEAQPSEFFIVVPATPVVEMWVEAMIVPLGGIPDEPDASAQAHELAEERLAASVDQLRAVGVTVHGQVGDRDPVRAVESVLRDATFDEIIVSTLSRRVSRWLHQDLPCRLERRFGLPVRHVAAAEHAVR